MKLTLVEVLSSVIIIADNAERQVHLLLDDQSNAEQLKRARKAVKLAADSFAELLRQLPKQLPSEPATQPPDCEAHR